MAMENVNTNNQFGAKSILKILSIMVVSVTLIVIAMPNTEKPKLTYETGNPWTNAQLISPGEILIQKDPRLVEQEQQEALQNEYLPYYSLDKSTGEKQTAAFISQHSDGDLSAYCLQSVANILADIYKQGIISLSDYTKLTSEDSLASIIIVDDKIASRKPVRDCLSTKQAYELLFNDKRIEAEKEKLQKININEFLVPNVIYDAQRSEQAKHDIIAMIPTNSGVIKPGQEIINRGDIITEEKARMIDSYNAFLDTQSNNTWYDLLRTNGIQWTYVAMLMLMLMLYLQLFRRDYLPKQRSLNMVFFLVTVFPVVNSIIMRFDPRNIYILPICLVPMFIRVFLDSRTAFMTHVVTVLICAAPVSDKFEYIFIQMSAGVIAICGLRAISKRSSMFLTAGYVAVTCLVAYTVTKFLNNKDVTFELLKHSYMCFVLNGILLLLAYPFMLFVERAFGFISPVTLIELSDTNRGILRELSERAPGTFQHSIMVGNIAAAIASEIGAKSLMVRTGALYHDIGKLRRPTFFTENQAGINPHTRLTPQVSAKVIISHVTDGVEKAKENGVPDVLRNFILTHHGKGLTKFFYNTYKNEHPNEEIDDTPFRYPGPNPFSKEQAILMMADAVEAASRSLSKYDEESIAALVNKIVDSQVAEGFFNECPITFRDIATAKRILIERLGAIYHPRIQYPELATKEQKQDAAETI
ncbi:MAG: HDIG domain-containing protein [Prevotella sp.]|nr:HDIG domain-containing protein [Prevotella sp.]